MDFKTIEGAMEIFRNLNGKKLPNKKSIKRIMYRGK